MKLIWGKNRDFEYSSLESLKEQTQQKLGI